MNSIRRTLLLFLVTGTVVLNAGAAASPLHTPSGLHATVFVGVPAASAEVGFFYDQLSPYGRWIHHRDYGWVWTPRAARASWHPYSQGRWVDSDYGWTWASDEPFGWATYHYGRWAFDPAYGWIWLPGTDWAPAWVSWQEGDGYIGWAPLPPSVGFSASVGLQLGGLDLSIALAPSAYVFVPERVFLEPRLATYVVAPSRNTTLCRGSRNVTRYRYSNNRWINGGLQVDRIERVTHRRVERLRIQEVNRRAEAGLRGRDLRVFRPAREQLRTVRVAGRNNAGFTPAPREAKRPERHALPAPPASPRERRQAAGTPPAAREKQANARRQAEGNRQRETAREKQRRAAQHPQAGRAKQAPSQKKNHPRNQPRGGGPPPPGR